MKNVTVKVITISSQLLVVTLFLTLVFSGGTNNQNITIGNNNFDKMADKTMTLFKSEELLLSSVDTSVVVPLDDDTKNRFLTIIENEATRLTRLIDDILLLSTIENKTKKKVEKVDLFEVFEEVHEVINYIAKKKNIKVKYDFENKDIDLWEYSGYIRQILLNIISNAIKYTGENGKVSIKQYIKSEKVFIEVKDNGIGIPEEDIERIFERFYRVDKARSRSVGGTGLGLAITKHMVKALNGNIRVEREIGVGSKFIIELPFNTELAKKVS